ncbi:MAG: hypothetical protein Q8L86_02375 [Vicinamibacterales bacterium]|nr:hypothetical protein [Vicinamibacterales bacterium]
MEYLVFERRHSTGIIARIYRDDEGAGYRAACLPAQDEADEPAWPYVDTLTEAEALADALAHEGCTGHGCGAWVSASDLPYRP